MKPVLLTQKSAFLGDDAAAIQSLVADMLQAHREAGHPVVATWEAQVDRLGFRVSDPRKPVENNPYIPF